MRDLPERAYFLFCLALGRLLRSAKYSKTRVTYENGAIQVRKHRVFYAPLLVRMSDPLVRLLNTGVSVLPQRDWEEREREVYQTLRRASVQVDPDGVVVLPPLPGETLAVLLEDPALGESVRETAIELAVVALSDLHRQGITHGDAMAENVMIDLEAGVAHWFDFETTHDSSRPLAWRRGDDVRALLATCLLRTRNEDFTGTLELVMDIYADDEVARRLATTFASVLRRPLTFHLGQAGLSYHHYRVIARLLSERLGE